jgi:ABC-type sugar transport system ATPase subunit
MKDYILKLKDISKKFGHIEALKNIDLNINRGEVVGIIGDNGAGKSTLMKIISGAYIPDNGEIYLKGEKTSFKSPRQAYDKGIAIIYQDLALANMLSVTKNIFMGKQFKKWLIFADDRKMRKKTKNVLKRLKTTIKSIDQPVFELSGGQQHSVATAKILVGKSPEIIIMDEPTAGLGIIEAEKIINLIFELKNNGMTILFISHNLEHVFEVSDRIIVLLGGMISGELKKSEFDRKNAVNMIVGVE